MKKLIEMSLAAIFAISAAYPVNAQDNANIQYDTFTKCKDNGRCKKKVRPYEPAPAAYGYPRNIEVWHYNTYYGNYPYNSYYPDYGYPFYGYPWHRDDYRILNRNIYNGRGYYDRGYYRR